MLVFDIETDGLLAETTVVHCINVIDRATGKRLAFNGGVYADGTPAPRDGSIDEGLVLLEDADCVSGHNIIWFDIPAIQKLYPRWKPKGRVVDTLVCSRVIWTDLSDRDFAALRSSRLPPEFQRKGLIGSHSLEAWGYRLGEHKGEFKGPWSAFTKEMDEYGRQDLEPTLKLLEKIEAKNYSQECLDLEHAVCEIVYRQHAHGFAFDMAAALALTQKLQRRQAEIASELQLAFQPWYAPDVAKGTAIFTPKKDNRKQGYVGGAPLSKVRHVLFNPDSRDHIADRLMRIYGWRPSVFTDGGKPQVDETTLEALPWPEARLAAEYLTVAKRLGQVATGKEAWIKRARLEADGVYRVHGRVNTNGAVTGRMTHSEPNVTQVPAVGSPYGEECRSCFIAAPGLVLVGCDAEGIELRCLGHYMARYDGGAFGRAVVDGKKEDETDAHSVNRKAMGLNKRDSAKTWIYAMIYGAGDYKLGCIVYDDFTDEVRERFNQKFKSKSKRAAALKRLGERSRARIMENLPALGKLVEAVKAAVRKRGYLVGLDGRLLHVRGEHAALNTLLQSAGAVIMKKALILMDQAFTPYLSTYTVRLCATVHDEVQLECNEEIADDIGRVSANAIALAGSCLGLRCPMSGSYNIGGTWAATH